MLLGIFAMTCVRFRYPLLERPFMMTGDQSKSVKWGLEVPVTAGYSFAGGWLH